MIFPNASCGHAERVLDHLGIREHFSVIWDIAAAGYIPKPDPQPYAALIDRLQVDARRAIMVEDIARNLEPAHALGMTTVWIGTSSTWAAPAAGARHVDHRIGDVTSWLKAVVDARKDAAGNDETGNGGRIHPTAPEPTQGEPP